MVTPRSQVEFADVADFENIPEASSVRERQGRKEGKSEYVKAESSFFDPKYGLIGVEI